MNAKKSPWRALIGLLVIAAVGITTLVIGTFASDASYTPKLALDLEGGTQVILTPKNTAGSDAREVTAEDMAEAINVIRQRVDASGVAEAEISTLGSDSIVVAIPGQANAETLDLIRQSATMRFRPVLAQGYSQAALEQFSQSGAQSGEQSGGSEESQSSEAPQSDEVSQSGAAEVDPETLADEPTQTPENNSDFAWVTERVLYDFENIDCADPEAQAAARNDDPAKPLVACDTEGMQKFILGPADIEGERLKSATAGMIYNQTGQSTGKWGVNLELDAEGTEQFAAVSQRLYDFHKANENDNRGRFAVVLDGSVIVAPNMNVPISDGKAQIEGNFTASSASALANQLSFGSLPLNFEVQTEQQISATLGANHLEKGIWAGIIGLILVVLWMLWQYRGLTLVSAGSLIVAAGLTYLAITLLSWLMGYRLSLPGVVGLIVAVGITADSFIVYFERIRDEVRDGRPLADAVETGWKRARRTVMISDAVNLVAAVVLYLLAVGGVQGFAFTLGLTTIIDLVVIFLFTHPLMSLLMRTRFFGEGHKWSGLDPEHLGAKSGAVYAGRGRVLHPKHPGEGRPERGKSLAERKRESVTVSDTAQEAGDAQ